MINRGLTGSLALLALVAACAPRGVNLTAPGDRDATSRLDVDPGDRTVSEEEGSLRDAAAWPDAPTGRADAPTETDRTAVGPDLGTDGGAIADNAGVPAVDVVTTPCGRNGEACCATGAACDAASAARPWRAAPSRRVARSGWPAAPADPPARRASLARRAAVACLPPARRSPARAPPSRSAASGRARAVPRRHRRSAASSRAPRAPRAPSAADRCAALGGDAPRSRTAVRASRTRTARRGCGARRARVSDRARAQARGARPHRAARAWRAAGPACAHCQSPAWTSDRAAARRARVVRGRRARAALASRMPAGSTATRFRAGRSPPAAQGCPAPGRPASWRASTPGPAARARATAARAWRAPSPTSAARAPTPARARPRPRAATASSAPGRDAQRASSAGGRAPRTPSAAAGRARSVAAGERARAPARGVCRGAWAGARRSASVRSREGRGRLLPAVRRRGT